MLGFKHGDKTDLCNVYNIWFKILVFVSEVDKDIFGADIMSNGEKTGVKEVHATGKEIDPTHKHIAFRLINSLHSICL